MLVPRSRTCRAIRPPAQEYTSTVKVFIMVTVVFNLPLSKESMKLWLDQPSDFHWRSVNMFSSPMPGENYDWQASLRNHRVRQKNHITNSQNLLFYIFRSKISEGNLSCGLIKWLDRGDSKWSDSATWFSTSILHIFAIKLNNVSPAKVLTVLRK